MPDAFTKLTRLSDTHQGIERLDAIGSSILLLRDAIDEIHGRDFKARPELNPNLPYRRPCIDSW
jgi:hypothetical protein